MNIFNTECLVYNDGYWFYPIFKEICKSSTFENIMEQGNIPHFLAFFLLFLIAIVVFGKLKKKKRQCKNESLSDGSSCSKENVVLSNNDCKSKEEIKSREDQSKSENKIKNENRPKLSRLMCGCGVFLINENLGCSTHVANQKRLINQRKFFKNFQKFIEDGDILDFINEEP